MAVGAFVLFAAALVTVLLAVEGYNRLVRLKHAVAKAWSNIDVLLKQRHDELPKLVEACRRHADFERATLERVLQARAAAQSAREATDVRGVGAAETEMRRGLGRLFALAEAYPELGASASFRQLQARISDLEASIADRREFYNASVYAYNVGIERFPDMIFALLFAFRPGQLLEFTAAEKADASVGTLFR